MNTWQMLLYAANSLFDNMVGDMIMLRENVLKAPTLAECNKFSMVKTAADLCTGAFNTTPGVWESLTTTVFISKLEQLRDFLSMCKGASLAYKAEMVGLPIAWVDDYGLFGDSSIAICWITSENKRLSLYHSDQVVHVRFHTELDKIFHIISGVNTILQILELALTR